MEYKTMAKQNKGYTRQVKGADHRITVAQHQGRDESYYFKDERDARDFQIAAMRWMIQHLTGGDCTHDVERLNLNCYGGKPKLYWEAYGTPNCCSPSSETYWSN